MILKEKEVYVIDLISCFLEIDVFVLMFQICVINIVVYKIMLFFFVLQVQFKIMYNNDYFDWNQILKIGIQFLSMCERFKFIVRDWYVFKGF